MYKFSLLYLLAIGVTLAGCDLINPSDPVPAYVEVDQITVDPVVGTGTTKQDFEEVWVYLDGGFIGAYSLPATIPLIASGPSQLQCFPGIRVNGIRSTADFYPFFQPYEITPTLEPGEVLSLDMHTHYRSNAVMAFLEDFESNQLLSDDLDGDPATSVERETTTVFEGNASGRIILTADANFIQVGSEPLLTTLPVDGTPVYLEMHYKNNVEFTVGLVGHGAGIPPSKAPILVLKPQEEWSKVYVALAPALEASQLDGYQLFFTASHDSTLAQSEIYLDNLKVVHIAQ